METRLDNYLATCSDSYNAFEWQVLVFKDNRNVGMHTYSHKPSKQDLDKLLRGYKNNDK